MSGRGGMGRGGGWNLLYTLGKDFLLFRTLNVTIFGGFGDFFFFLYWPFSKYFWGITFKTV